MFSALRLRILELILPSSKQDGRPFHSRLRSRLGLQSPWAKVQDGRISKRMTQGNISAGVFGALDSAVVSSPRASRPNKPERTWPSRIRRRKQSKKRKTSSKPKPIGHPDRNVTPEELSSPDSPTDNFKNKSRLPMLYKTEEAEHFLDLEAEGSSIRNSLAVENHPFWTTAEIDLFNKLNMRGFEPLLPRTWELDFPTVPSALFSGDMQNAFMKAMYGSDFRAIHALSVLLELGARVRDCVSLNIPPEKVITRHIQQYIRWSHQDGNLVTKSPIPILQVVTARADEPVKDVVDRASQKLQNLGQQYRTEWLMPEPPKAPKQLKDKAANSGDSITDDDEEEVEDEEEEMQDEEEPDEFDPPLPTVYGLVIAYTTVSLITYDSNQPDREMKALALFDFMLNDQDVWNAFAVAIIVVWARDYLDGLEWNDVPQIAESDPDL